ncbi:MAG: hypothetical protein Q9223_000017 [Gallowayella weberi]
MSSRALRKLRREQEQHKQGQDADIGSGEDEISEEEPAKEFKVPNAFDLLHQADDGDLMGGNEEEAADSQDASEPGEGGKESPVPSSSNPNPKQKKKKKKPKKKSAKSIIDKSPSKDSDKLDEIDLALRSLSTPSSASHPETANASTHDSFPDMYRLLAVDSKNLNASNEMKRLFGSVVLEGENEDPGPPRRRGRVQHLDLGGALAGRNSPVSRGQGLVGLALRKNVFIAGKEEWPKATSGGLGMELVEKLNDGTTEYRFVHNTAYQDVQRQFEICVESLDPQRLIHLLQYNPYHISTLLQVSEVAKQQGDHSVSGDLLERALFSFGRSVHSSFITAISQGKARLDFRRPENREFWLAAWRYVANLGQRGTWRTSYEWAKLVLSVDPEGDPYCVTINLDQLALRGGQAENFLNLCKCAPFDQFSTRPNLRISSALARYRLKDAQGSRAQLREVIREYPYIFTRLFQELSLDHPPKSIWGQKARSSREEFECEVYLNNAKDLWNTPEAISLLVEVAESLDRGRTPKTLSKEIDLDEARHILLAGNPALIKLLPRTFTTMHTTSSDPLPPPDGMTTYSAAPDREITQRVEASDRPPARGPIPAAVDNGQINEDEAEELQGLQNFFSRILPWFRSGATPNPDEGFELAAAESGVPQEVITERGSRLVQLLRRVVGGTEQTDSPVHQQEQPERLPQDGIHIQSAAEAERTLIEDADMDEPGLFEPGTVDQTPLTSHGEAYDDEKNQRWLAGQGMIGLREFTARHGTDEQAWGSSRSEGEELVSEYVTRVQQLRQQRTRNFIVNYPLRQGTSAAVRDLIQRRLEENGGP